MGESELKIALRREGELLIRDFWEAAETGVVQRREAIDAELEQLRDQADRASQAELAGLRSTLLFEARARAMQCRLHAETAMQERLLKLARESLTELGGTERVELWQALLRELPSSVWTRVRVHPLDRSMAEDSFPEAIIDCDEAISAGMIVSDAEDMVRIDNTLNCRLMRVWPDLVPKLLEALRKQVDTDEVAAPDTTG